MSNIEDKKYYWVLFFVKKYIWNDKGISLGCNEIWCEELTDQHPLKLLIERREKYGQEHAYEPPQGYKTREDYALRNWKEITEAEYSEFKDWI